MSHLSFEGQSKVSYCLECSEKHGQTAKVLLREALERAETNGVNTEGVMEKMRGVVAELTGMEDDTTLNRKPDNEAEEKVIELHIEARDIRKEIYASKCEIGGCEVEILREITQRLDDLVDEVYRARQTYECPNCTTRAREFSSALTHVDDNSEAPARRRKKFIEDVRRSVKKP